MVNLKAIFQAVVPNANILELCHLLSSVNRSFYPIGDQHNGLPQVRGNGNDVLLLLADLAVVLIVYPLLATEFVFRLLAQLLHF
jgi:hypothetical protein